MTIRIKILMVASVMIGLAGIWGAGYAESKVPYLLKYELPYSEWTYTSHTVTFAHSTHAMEYKIACIQCHHTLEAGAIAVEETCRDCHLNPEMKSFQQAEKIPEEERMDYYFLAIHDQCINCHKTVKEHNDRAQAPVGCKGCHVRQQKYKFH